MMPFVRYPQRQTPMLTPLADLRLLLQIRTPTAPMTRPEVLIAPVGNDAPPAGAPTIGDGSLSAHRRISPVRVSLVTEVEAG